MSGIPIARALDTVQANLVACLKICGEKIGFVRVQLDVNGSTASIDFDRNRYTGAVECTVFFPVMPVQSFISREEMNRWIGYAIHELCHALFSSRNAWNIAVSARISPLVNGLEDVRIEKKLNDTGILVNSYEILNGLLAWVTAQCPANYDPNDFSQLPWTVAMVGRIRVCGYAIPVAETFAAKLTPTNQVFLDWIMDRIRSTQNTMDVVTLALEIQTRLAKPAPQMPQTAPQMAPQAAPEPGTGEGEGEGESAPETAPEPGTGEGEGEGESVSQAAPEPGNGEGEGEGEDTGKPDESGKGEDTGKPDESGEGEDTGKPESSDISGEGGSPAPYDVTNCKPVDMNPLSPETLKESLDLQRKVMGDVHKDMIEAQRINPAAPLPPVSPYVRYQLIDELREKLGLVNRLKNEVASVLRASDHTEWSRSRPAGRLDRSAMARIGAGFTDNVFTVRKDSEGYETEITVLIDASDSMISSGGFNRVNRSMPATVLAMAVASAAFQVGVPCEIIQFSSDWFRVVKSPKEKPTAPDVLARFAATASHTSGFTPLSVSIVRAACRLTARAPFKRRILFAVTDGGCDHGPDAIKTACGVAAGMGVETVGLCIDLQPLGFPLAARCKSNAIEKAGLGILKTALTR
jgi:hypothetical protein